MKRPIFIVGCPRSGTSITADLFGTHPGVANWSEAGRLWDPVDYRNADADHCWGEDRVTEKAARRLHGWCEWYRRSQAKERFLNKHPRNSVRIDYLRRIFPDALFVHMIRDGRAVVSSMLNQIRTGPRRQAIPFGNFCKPPRWRDLLRDDLVEQTALQWREIVRHVLDRRERLGEQYFEVRYEQLCARTRETFKALFAFTALPADEDLLARLPEGLEDQNHRSRAVLADEEIATIERIQGDLLKELGYET